ncbi:MAG: hypothetical protein ACKO96_15360 [Flammeovirgaceae bacterium]
MTCRGKEIDLVGRKEIIIEDLKTKDGKTTADHTKYLKSLMEDLKIYSEKPSLMKGLMGDVTFLS